MTNSSRKILRKNLPEKKKEAEKKLTEHIGMFGRLPDRCDLCKKDFDKKSKEMAQTWFVVVKNEQKVVRLFCPECFNKAKEIINNESRDNWSF